MALIVAAFVFGGGSRGDIASLVVLRPLSCLLLAYAVVVGDARDLRRHAAMWLFAAALVLIAGGHLVPLPPSLWHALPGRDIVASVDEIAGMGAIARPLTLNATEGLNALYSLVVPLAALALVAVQRADWRRTALYTVLALGGATIVLSLLQVLGPPQGPFYTYRITNGSSPVGLFANRNHNAVFLAGLLPALAIVGAGGSAPHRGQRDWRPARHAGAWIGAALAMLFILASGSRAGLLLAALAVLLTPFVLGTKMRDALLPEAMPPKTRAPLQSPRMTWIGRYWRLVAAALVATAVALLAAFSRLGTAAGRLANEGDNRTQIWDATWPLVGRYLPWGSGNGSFVDVFKLHEPYSSLGPKYTNHAHNDVLETALTIGLPGMILMGIFLFSLVRSGISLWKSRGDTSFTARIRRLGYVLLVLLPLASLVDYPLRTPAMMVMFVVAAAWLTERGWSVSLAGSRRG